MLDRWQATIVDEKGNIRPGAVVQVRSESTGAIATVFKDADGTQPWPTGFVTADENGYVYFHARPDWYRLTSFSPAIDWRFVNVGARPIQNTQQTFLTYADMQGFTPDESPYFVQVTNDPDDSKNGYYVWDGSAWQWSGVQPVNQSDLNQVKAYADLRGTGQAWASQYPNLLSAQEWEDYTTLIGAGTATRVQRDGVWCLELSGNITDGGAKAYSIPAAQVSGDLVSASVRAVAKEAGAGMNIRLRQLNGTTEVASEQINLPAAAVTTADTIAFPAIAKHVSATTIQLYFDAGTTGAKLWLNEPLVAPGAFAAFRGPDTPGNNVAPDPFLLGDGVTEGGAGRKIFRNGVPVLRVESATTAQRTYRMEVSGDLAPGKLVYLNGTLLSDAAAGAEMALVFFTAEATEITRLTIRNTVAGSAQVRQDRIVVPSNASYAEFRAGTRTATSLTYAEISLVTMGRLPPDRAPYGQNRPQYAVGNYWRDPGWAGRGLDPGTASTGTVKADANSPEAGQPYLELANGVSSNEVRQYLKFPAEGIYAPGREVTLRGDFRSNASIGASFDLVFLDDSEAEVLPSGGRLSISNTTFVTRWWTDVKTRTVPATAKWVRPRVVRWNSAGATYARIANVEILPELVGRGRAMRLYSDLPDAAGSAGGGVMFFDQNGSDTNNGTSGSRLATPAKAIELSGGVVSMIGGGTFEGINIPLASARKIEVVRERGRILRFLLGTKVTGATKTAGRSITYEAALAVAPDGTGSVHGHNWIWEHGSPSGEIEIFDPISPLRKGQTHRLPSTRLVQRASIDEVDANPGSWYWESGVLYLSPADSGDASLRTYYVPERANGKSGVSGGTRSQIVKIVGAEFWYANEGIDVTETAHYELEDCTVYCSRGNGIKSGRSEGIERGCEVAGATNDGTNCHGWDGDGTNPARVKSRRLVIDAWNHDCGDDGESSHERCDVTWIGGLCEYNGGRGIATANGAQFAAYNPTTAYNGQLQATEGEGLGCVGSVNTTIGDTTTTMIVHGGLSVGDRYGAAANGENTFLRLIGTEIRNSTTAALYANRGTIVHTNVRESGSAQQKLTANGGTITADNGELVE